MSEQDIRVDARRVGGIQGGALKRAEMVSGHRDYYVAEPRNATDDSVVAVLDGLPGTTGTFRAFRGWAGRKHTHGLIQYPAMMVPEMQAVLVKAVAAADGRVGSVHAPFAGSGMTLIESMRKVLNFVGQDINPLAVLVCRAKSAATAF